MDIIIMNFILVTAIVILGYYILDAVVSLFMFRSSSNKRNRRKISKNRSFDLINVENNDINKQRTMNRCVNS
ncbi:hypothetical protein BXO88_11250 [Oribacterium sp. C9]|uniref:hypothetical protein n=1 Tax=Oribacterium sp. C9 TaxID=1943579 RepID=UPI00098ED846|nr:hypothetical protein [Oribacterium sp. C9]OON85658.1 hypothetical protein BXO88_11250 [Oribacterium sp. C9]